MEDLAAREADEMLQTNEPDKPPQELGDDQVWPNVGPVCPDASGSPNQ